MAHVYILRHGAEDVFKVGRTKGDLSKTVAQLSRGNPCAIKVHDYIVTDEEVAGETYLHHRLRSRRVVDGGGREFFKLPLEELDAAIQDTRTYIDEFIEIKKKADDLCEITDDGSIVEATAEDKDAHRNICLLKEEEDDSCVRRKFFEYKLKLKMGRAAALGNLVTWKTQSKSSFDQSSFQREHPELFAAFQRTTTSRFFRLK